jgi:hypothetical protein
MEIQLFTGSSKIEATKLIGPFFEKIQGMVRRGGAGHRPPA